MKDDIYLYCSASNSEDDDNDQGIKELVVDVEGSKVNTFHSIDGAIEHIKDNEEVSGLGDKVIIYKVERVAEVSLSINVIDYKKPEIKKVSGKRMLTL